MQAGSAPARAWAAGKSERGDVMKLERWIRIGCLALVWGFLCLAATAGENEFRFVVLSDVHVGRSAKWEGRYAAMASEIAAADPKPAAVFATGDLTDHGLESEYDDYARLFIAPLKAAGIPHYGIPGNHELGGDTNHNTLAMWTNKMGAAYQAVTIGKTRFILTCGVPAGFTGGYGSKGAEGKIPGLGQAGFIDATQLAWIHNELKSPAATNASLIVMMNHFPLWREDFGGYQIMDVDFFGNPTKAGSSLQRWMDEYRVEVFMCGHRHFQAAPVLHDWLDRRATLHVLNESSVMGKALHIDEPNRSRQRTYGVVGFDVYDVSGRTLRHYRKTLASYGFDKIGKLNEFTYDAATLRLEVVAPATNAAAAQAVDREGK